MQQLIAWVVSFCFMHFISQTKSSSIISIIRSIRSIRSSNHSDEEVQENAVGKKMCVVCIKMHVKVDNTV